MKKIIIILFLGALNFNLYAQKVIEKPEYEFSTVHGELTKIEVLDTATVLHFHIKDTPKAWISIPKETFIKNVDSDEKLFVTKADGIPLAERFFMPDSGETTYKLYFPKLDKAINKIDFGEANDGETWFIYDIVINEDESDLACPKVLRGDWLLTDGSNQWHYTFNSKIAIVDRAIWNYKSVERKGKKYTINLERLGAVKTVHAKLNGDGHVDFGLSPKTLQSYSLEKTNNPNYKLVDNLEYDESMFKIDSTIYSGVIKGYSSKVGQKTGTVYVNNVFTGQQYTHLVKIADDGSFSIKLAVSYPQYLLVRLPGFNGSVFVEPSKQTFHFLNGKKSLFMGDCAQINSDLEAMKYINYFKYRSTMNKIGVTSPDDYKKICFDVRDKELVAVKVLAENQFISNKALQIKTLDIEYGAFERASGYNMYRSSLERKNKSAKKENQKKPFKTFNTDQSFFDFITPESINNKLAVLSTYYKSFVNRLMYADVFRGDFSTRSTMVEMADWLKKQGKELTVDELMMVEMSKEIETPEVLVKEADFRKAHGDVEQAFYRKHMKDYMSFSKENKDKPKFDSFLLNLADFVTNKGDTLSQEEVKMIAASKNVKTDVEKENEKEFNKAHGLTRSEFYKKYSANLSELSKYKRYTTIDNNIKDYFNVPDAYLYDVMVFQRAAKKMEDYEVYNNVELDNIQNEIKDSFLDDYIVALNEATKVKIEANKTKGGYHVNTVEKTEGDELFEAMIKKFKGKVVYVDFWATWCGPCMSGISRIKPLKEEMKNEDVVFLYITNQSSPEKTWKNAIPNIKGEHYRVSKDEWNYLSDKFKITGIPHYTLVNKEGQIVKAKMRHNSNSKLKSILNEQLK